MSVSLEMQKMNILLHIKPDVRINLMSLEIAFHDLLFQYINGYVLFPNYLVDIIQPICSSSTWKVLSVVWRELIGRQVWEDNISLRKIQKHTTISRPVIIASLNQLEEYEILIIQRNYSSHKGGRPNTLKINKTTLYLLYQLEKEGYHHLSVEEYFSVLKYKEDNSEELITITPKMWEELLQKIGSKKSLSKNSEGYTINNKEGENAGENNSLSE
ncbi:MAG: hypothetical protein U5P10_15020 [Spirochaetia bacterium]|nr:hypothetical protein [Spirochaetia bacterium]